MPVFTLFHPVAVPRSSPSHPSGKYAQPNAFDRLLLLIATLAQHPGVGFLDPTENTDQPHNALAELHTYLQKTAQAQGVELPHYSVHTLHKDLALLRSYGILGEQMYRWGYYLGTGAMSETELKVALNVLHSQAKYQRDPQVKQVYERVTKRLRGLDPEGQFFYPVRAQMNRSIVETDPVEMASRMETQRSLFHQMETVENAILQGQRIEIYRKSDPYETKQIGYFQVWPLQLLHYDIAWYLIYEHCQNGHLAISRIDRFEDYCKILDPKSRSLTAQKRSLKFAHELLENGWGLYLGSVEEQRQELTGQLNLIAVTVRFFPKVVPFITEGSLRHARQSIHPGPKATDGKLSYVDYQVELPPRSLKEFSFWIFRFMGNAQVRSPDWLVQEHREAAQQQVALYDAF